MYTAEVTEVMVNSPDDAYVSGRGGFARRNPPGPIEPLELSACDGRGRMPLSRSGREAVPPRNHRPAESAIRAVTDDLAPRIKPQDHFSRADSPCQAAIRRSIRLLRFSPADLGSIERKYRGGKVPRRAGGGVIYRDSARLAGSRVAARHPPPRAYGSNLGRRVSCLKV